MNKSSTDINQVNAIRLFLGGSFDPVHHGHMTLLYHVMAKIAAAYPQHIPIHASFLPAARSPLKDSSLAPEHRLNMLRLAITDYQQALAQKNATTINSSASQLTSTTPSICELELWQTPPTYTIDTLQTLREHYRNDSIVFIMGADNAASLTKWRAGLLLTTQAHLWICPRNHWQNIDGISAALPSALHSQISTDICDLKNTTNGRIYIDDTAMMQVSSSQIRQQIRHHQNDKDAFTSALIADSVYDYIRQHRLYTDNPV